MATHSSILAWRIPWTEEAAGLQSWGHRESDTTECLTTSVIYLSICPSSGDMVLVTQSCLTPCDHIAYSPLGSSDPWTSPGKNTGVGSHFLLQGIFPTQRSNPHLPSGRQILFCLSHQGSLFIIYYQLSVYLSTVERVGDFIFWAPKSLQIMIAAMKLKDDYSLEGKL